MKLLAFVRQLINNAKTVLKSKEEANTENVDGLIRIILAIYRKKMIEEVI